MAKRWRGDLSFVCFVNHRSAIIIAGEWSGFCRRENLGRSDERWKFTEKNTKSINEARCRLETRRGSAKLNVCKTNDCNHRIDLSMFVLNSLLITALLLHTQPRLTSTRNEYAKKKWNNDGDLRIKPWTWIRCVCCFSSRSHVKLSRKHFRKNKISIASIASSLEVTLSFLFLTRRVDCVRWCDLKVIKKIKFPHEFDTIFSIRTTSYPHSDFITAFISIC